MLLHRGHILKIACIVLIVCVLFGTILGLGQPATTSADNLQVQMCFILDGSGSISTADWAIMKNGLAAAIANPTIFPHDGSVELTIIQFGWRESIHGYPATAKVEISPVIVTATNAATVAFSISSITHSMGVTPMACGINLAADTLYASPNFDPSL